MAVSPVGGFHGVPFYIRDFSDSGMNRSIIVHEFPNQTNPYLEDLAANTLRFRFSAFISNDSNLYMSRYLLAAVLRVKSIGELAPLTGNRSNRECRGVFPASQLLPRLRGEAEQG